MTDPIDRQTPPARTAKIAAAALFAVALGLAPAFAQSGKDQGKEPSKPPGRETQKPEAQKPDPKLPAAPEAPGAEAAKPATKPVARIPQTAQEKAKLLADLYAQLAAAEDEEQAKKFTGAIERLWVQSGSDTVSLLLDRAAHAGKEKKLELAQKLLDATVSLAPDYAEGFNQRAYFHFTLNNFDAAVGDLRRVLALDPNHYKALEGLAQIWRETGNKKGAYGVLKRLIEVHPFAAGAKTAHDELKREVDGQGI